LDLKVIKKNTLFWKRTIPGVVTYPNNVTSILIAVLEGFKKPWAGNSSRQTWPEEKAFPFLGLVSIFYFTEFLESIFQPL